MFVSNIFKIKVQLCPKHAFSGIQLKHKMTDKKKTQEKQQQQQQQKTHKKTTL